MRPALLILACAAAFASEGDAPAAILARVMSRVRESSRNLPRYACVETITRDSYTALAPVQRSCDSVLAAANHRPLDLRLRRTWTDRLRLDVAVAPAGEMHSWVGESRFEDGRIDSIVTEGPVGTGAFAAIVMAVFNQQDVKSFRLVGGGTVNGRARSRFAFDSPVTDSHYHVKIGNEWPVVAYDGTFEADTETGELAWMEIRTAVLPPAAGSCQAADRLEFGRTALGNGEFLLATAVRQRFIASNGGEVINTIQFSGCREYRGDSTIKFETESAATAAGGKHGEAPAPLELPYGEKFSLELMAPIDSATAAAGDPFFARFTRPLTSRFGRTLVPRGSRVEGRILRVQTFYGAKPEVIVVLRPQRVEIRGVQHPLHVQGDIYSAAQQQRPVAGKKGALIILPLRTEVNAGLFRFPGDHTVIKRGFVSNWRTR